jgi:hypothetical protein
MRSKKDFGNRTIAVMASLICVMAFVSIRAQAPLPAAPPIPPQTTAPASAPSYSAAELDRVLSPIALYPDPLLAQVLAAMTFPQDIPDAARWADDHHYLIGRALTDAIVADHVTWDPSVQALLAFPSVLDMLASAMPWTQEVGNAFLAEPDAVMDAVQRLRHQAQQYGYLRSNPRVTVTTGPYIEITPISPDYVVVPYYDPYVVFGPPAPGFVVGTAIYFGFGVRLGAWWGPWGWGATRFGWPAHTVIIGNVPWGRTWGNRGGYVHPYPGVPRNIGPRLPDRHPPVPRTAPERAQPRGGTRGGHHR